jgi:hypothetical protein
MSEPEAEDLFEMANLYPKHTGLPIVIRVSERGRARHDAGVKIGTKHEPWTNINDTAVVGIRPLSVLAAVLISADRQAVYNGLHRMRWL